MDYTRKRKVIKSANASFTTGFTAAMVLTLWMQCGQVLAQTMDSNPLQLSPHHATALFADLDKEKEWYQRVLGFRAVARMRPTPDFEVLHMAIPGYRIDLVWRKGSSRPHDAARAPVQGWLHVVFKTPAIDADYQRLTALGADVKADRDPKNALARLVFHDPEGNELEIVPE
jgi:catechol 2,3-dioxygenase-like lactoylglutathione lyase family enzyme